jgi:anti-anti-sigma factor
MMNERLIVLGGLDLESRRLFIASASGAIDKIEGRIELDCSQIESLDGPTLGMLVTVARNAQRRGQRVVLHLPSARVTRDLDEAGVSNMFD